MHFASKDEYQRAVNHTRRVPTGLKLLTLGEGTGNEISAALVLKSSHFNFLLWNQNFEVQRKSIYKKTVPYAIFTSHVRAHSVRHSPNRIGCGVFFGLKEGKKNTSHNCFQVCWL